MIMIPLKNRITKFSNKTRFYSKAVGGWLQKNSFPFSPVALNALIKASQLREKVLLGD